MSNRIRELTAAKHLTLGELARRCEMDPSYLGKIASGQISPTVPTARRIAIQLAVSIDELFPERAA